MCVSYSCSVFMVNLEHTIASLVTVHWNIHLACTQNFPKNKHLRLDTHTYVVRNVSFAENFSYLLNE